MITFDQIPLPSFVRSLSLASIEEKQIPPRCTSFHLPEFSVKSKRIDDLIKENSI